MKRILIITPNCPYPPHKSGGTHALYNTIKENKKEKIYIDLLYYDEKDNAAEKELSKFVNNVIYQDLRKGNKKLVRVKSIIKGIPYGVYQYDYTKLKLDNDYDKIIFDQLLTIEFIEKISAKENVLMAYDSMPMYFLRKSEVENVGVVDKLYNKIQAKFYEKIQSENFEKFNKIIYVSQKDVDYEKVKNYEVADKFSFINLGVNTDLFNSEKYVPSGEKNIIFTGIMSYSPNKDAVMYFVKNILNRILKQHSNVKFYIVGKDPDNDIKALQNDNIVVTGFVDDIVKYLANATICISPLRYGSGMKNKVLEAMSAKKAIVASQVSIEGINELKHGENIFIANSDDEWVKFINMLLDDENLRKGFGIECRKIIENNYSWNKVFHMVIK